MLKKLKQRLLRNLNLSLFGKGKHASGGMYWYEEMIPAPTLRLIHDIKREPGMLLTDLEAYYVHLMANKTHAIPGEIAEVGVYKGGSAKLICTTTKKPVHLFDTFTGLPETSAK